MTTSDGKQWSKHQAPTNGILTSVEAFKGRFVATGEEGVILTSTTGSDWTAQASGTTKWLYRVRAFDEQLVAVGQAGTILPAQMAIHGASAKAALASGSMTSLRSEISGMLSVRTAQCLPVLTSSLGRPRA